MAKKTPIKTVHRKNPSERWKTQPGKLPSSDIDKPVWQFSLLDWDGPWGWRDVKVNQWQQILQKLGHFETRTWANIERLISDSDSQAVGDKRRSGISTRQILDFMLVAPLN